MKVFDDAELPDEARVRTADAITPFIAMFLMNFLLKLVTKALEEIRN